MGSLNEGLHKLIFSVSNHLTGRLAQCLLVFLLTGSWSNPLQAWELSGQTAFENRVFLQSPGFSDQRETIYYPSLLLSPELRHTIAGGRSRFTFSPFLRLEAYNTGRTHWDIRELNWEYTSEMWDITAGVAKTFWGVTESRHLVDIINQSDYLEDIDLENKLGQPMVNVNLSGRYGKVSLYYLPYFRERSFPNRSGRFRPVFPFDERHPEFESRLKSWHQDFAVRWSGNVGALDFGISQFVGTSREPTLRFAGAFPSQAVFVPHYDLINQTSVDVQLTQGSWLWKLEAITRGGQAKRFQALVVGAEYTWSGIGGSGVDVGLLAEYLYDGRDKTNAPPTLYNNDLFFGMRVAMNDVHDTEIKTSVVQDLEGSGRFINVQASRRIANGWKIDMTARWFMDAKPSDFILFSYQRDDYIQLRIAKHF